MAKIVYGLCGQGSGHSMRSREILNHLIKQGHQIKVVSYGIGYENLKDEFEVTKIEGLTFYYKNNEVKYFRTLWQNTFKSYKYKKSFDTVLKLVNEFKPDIMITDFETATALVANFKRIPLLSIDNQHVIIHSKIDVPLRYYLDYLITKSVIKGMVPRATEYFATSFFFPEVKNKRTELFHPIIRSDVFDLDVTEDDYIFVYSTSRFDKLLDLLKQTSQKFIVYGFDKDEVYENITFRKKDIHQFLVDLAKSKAIIGTSGFTLISEALYLKKPFLAVPVKKQFEQFINAYYLKKLGYGNYYNDLTVEKINEFIANLGKYRKHLDQYKGQGNKQLFKEIDRFVSSKM